MLRLFWETQTIFKVWNSNFLCFCSFSAMGLSNPIHILKIILDFLWRFGSRQKVYNLNIGDFLKIDITGLPFWFSLFWCSVRAINCTSSKHLHWGSKYWLTSEAFECKEACTFNLINNISQSFDVPYSGHCENSDGRTHISEYLCPDMGRHW